MKQSDRMVKREELVPNGVAFIRGKVQFARILRHATPKEIENRNKFNNGKNKMDLDVKYTTITISEATIIPADPNNWTPNEIYNFESFFVSKEKPELGNQFKIESRGRSLPEVKVFNPETNIVETLDNPPGEPDKGLDVIIAIRAYECPAGMGQSLDGVAVMEPYRAYSSRRGVDLTALSAAGIILDSPFNPKMATDDDTNTTGTDTVTPQTQPVQQPQYAQATTAIPVNLSQSQQPQTPAQTQTPQTPVQVPQFLEQVQATSGLNNFNQAQNLQQPPAQQQVPVNQFQQQPVVAQQSAIQTPPHQVPAQQADPANMNPWNLNAVGNPYTQGINPQSAF